MQQANYDEGDGSGHMGLVSVAAATIAVLAIGVGGSYWTRVGASPSLMAPMEAPTKAEELTDDDEKREKDNKSRSKDRRRRNKDPLLDVLAKGGSKKKGGKRANAVAKALSNLSANPAAVLPEETEVAEEQAGTSSIAYNDSPATPKAELPEAPVASTSSRPPLSIHKSSKTITALPLTASHAEKNTAVFPGPWDEGEALRAQLASSKHEDLLRSKSRRRDPSTQRDSSLLPTPADRPHTPSIIPASPTKRPDTPSSNSEVSTQTQIASLRGALEAARLREEKSKSDLDRMSKELEAMRWDHAGWRRRELDMQNQIAHLVHQLQSHAALIYHHAAASPTSPNNMMGMYQGSPYFPSQPLMSPPPFAQGPPPSASFPNVLYATSTSSRGGSSDASSEISTSSSGGSPHMNGNAGEPQRGRPRTKSSELSDGWGDVQIAQHSSSVEPSLSLPLPLSLSALRGNHSSDEENEEDLNDVLADAIFKNPIKFSAGSSPTKKQKPEEIEFEYPSLNSGYCAKPQPRAPTPDGSESS